MIAYLAVIVCLFLLSYTPFNLGDISFKFQKLEVSTKGNFLLIVIAALVFLLSCVRSTIKFMKKCFESENSRKSQEELIELLFREEIKSLIPSTTNVPKKHQILEKAIVCHLYEIYDTDPPHYLKADLQNKLVFTHESKVNFRKSLRESDVQRAKQFILEVITKAPQFCKAIQKEILMLARLTPLDFDPRQYKYNLSPKYVERYTEVIAERESNDVSFLMRANRNYPGNVKIALNLIKLLSDDKKVTDIIRKGFEKSPDRRLAIGLLLLKNKENLLEIAEAIVSCNNKCIEGLWFMCITATELGHISKASCYLKEIMKSEDASRDEIAKFFIVNHSKFAHDTEILEDIREMYTTV